MEMGLGVAARTGVWAGTNGTTPVMPPPLFPPFSSVVFGDTTGVSAGAGEADCFGAGVAGAGFGVRGITIFAGGVFSGAGPGDFGVTDGFGARGTAFFAAGDASGAGDTTGSAGGRFLIRGVGVGVTFAGVGVAGVPMNILRKSDGFFGFGVTVGDGEGLGVARGRIRGRGVASGDAWGAALGAGVASGEGVETTAGVV